VSLGRIALDQRVLAHAGKLDWFLYLRSYTYAFAADVGRFAPAGVDLRSGFSAFAALMPVGFTRAPSEVDGGGRCLAGLLFPA